MLVTNLDHEILSLGQLYRDRADTERTGELKTSGAWNWLPTTHDLCIFSTVREACVALIYNW